MSDSISNINKKTTLTFTNRIKKLRKGDWVFLGITVFWTLVYVPILFELDRASFIWFLGEYITRLFVFVFIPFLIYNYLSNRRARKKL